MVSPTEVTALGAIVLIALAIVFICIRWMKSTRASQRRVDQQNERIIDLLEQIAGREPGGRP